VFTARPQAILFEAANPRHSHEWEDFQELTIPGDRVLVPGVIDTTTNFVEHPQLIALRIVNFAKLVGKDRVIAGTDCGFATFAGPDNPVAPSVVWAKLKALSDGAGLANERLAS
jgi:5-methyltetrahydropteroyltriglutamate--homocysteine methyltransferase